MAGEGQEHLPTEAGQAPLCSLALSILGGSLLICYGLINLIYQGKGKILLVYLLAKLLA